MRKINRNLVFKLLGITAVILVGVSWIAPRVRPAAQAQGIASPGLPLTTAYFYGPVSASANHMVKMCSNNLFGDGSYVWLPLSSMPRTDVCSSTRK